MNNKDKAAAGFRPEISEPFENGFNLKIVFAAFFIGFIMLPGSIYLGLLTGGGLGGTAQWVTVILLVEIAKRSFVPLKKQEIFILYILSASVMSSGMVMGTAGLSLPGGAFGQLIWQQYLVQSQYAKSFGLTQYIPSWAVPPAGFSRNFEKNFFQHGMVHSGFAGYNTQHSFPDKQFQYRIYSFPHNKRQGKTFFSDGSGGH